MKIKILVFFLFSLFFCLHGCRTRKIDVKKEQLEGRISDRVESVEISEELISHLKKIVEKSRVSGSASELKLVPVLDSSGTVQPVIYEEFRQGKPYRQVKVTGGSLVENQNSKVESRESKAESQKTKIEAQRSRVDSLFSAYFSAEKKERDILVKGMDFILYLIIGMAVVLAAFVAYASWQFRRFKSFLNGV